MGAFNFDVPKTESSYDIGQMDFNALLTTTIPLGPKKPTYRQYGDTQFGMRLQEHNPRGHYSDQILTAEESTLGEYLEGTWRNFSEEQVGAIQAELEAAGLLDKDRYRKGFVGDEATVQQIAFVWRTAKNLKISYSEALEMLKRHPVPKGDTGEKSQAEKARDAYMNQLTTVYLNNWGVPPPNGYIEGIAKSGMNIWEFEAHERNKPAWKNSPAHEYRRLDIEARVAQVLGSLG